MNILIIQIGLGLGSFKVKFEPLTYKEFKQQYDSWDIVFSIEISTCYNQQVS